MDEINMEGLHAFWASRDGDVHIWIIYIDNW